MTLTFAGSFKPIMINFFQFGASISEGSEEFVHHMLVYQCPSFAINDESDESLRTSSMECDNSHRIVQSCRGTNVLAGWAIGGQVW